MANIKALENSIKEWEAKEAEFNKKGDSIGQNTTGIVAASLKLALNIINQPPNSVDATERYGEHCYLNCEHVYRGKCSWRGLCGLRVR